MSLQLCLLETGETIIADVREAIDPESNESLGYLVTNPFNVKHIINNVVNVGEMTDKTNTSPEDASSLAYSVWAPLARQNTFNFHKDFIRVIYNPDQTVADQYTEILTKWLEEHTLTVETDKHSTVVSMGSIQEQDELKKQLESMNPDDTEVNVTPESFKSVEE
tara:strand:+ start:628 stop:1119 length:492 start_codon:yes stop_codon:yes gene_type:complete